MNIMYIFLILLFMSNDLIAMSPDRPPHNAANFTKIRALIAQFKEFSRSCQKIRTIDPIIAGTIFKDLFATKIKIAKKIKNKKKLAIEYAYIEHGIYEAVDSLIGLYKIDKKPETLQDINSLMDRARAINEWKLQQRPHEFVISAKRIETCNKLRKLQESKC